MDADYQRDLNKLADLIFNIKVAMLTTAMPDGTLRSRPMATVRHRFDGTLWFFTGEDSPKVDEIQQDQHVNLSYVDSEENIYVSVSGRATVFNDPIKAKQLWEHAARTWFPKGPSDPNLMLLRVDVKTAEYWDVSSRAMVKLAGLVKGFVSTPQVPPMENRKVHL